MSDNNKKDGNAVPFGQPKAEQKISHIGAKIADAHDMSDQINDLADKQEKKLASAQDELSDLYETMDED